MINIDQVKNKAVVTLITGVGAGATTLNLLAGDGLKLADPVNGQYNIVLANTTDYPDYISDPNYEIFRVTAKVGDALTVTPAQEGTAAATHNIAGKTYKAMMSPTAKMFTDIQTEINTVAAFVPITVKAVLSGTNNYVDVADANITAGGVVKANWGVNDVSNSPFGSLYIMSQALGTVRVGSTVAEMTDKNIIVEIHFQ